MKKITLFLMAMMCVFCAYADDTLFVKIDVPENVTVTFAGTEQTLQAGTNKLAYSGFKQFVVTAKTSYMIKNITVANEYGTLRSEFNLSSWNNYFYSETDTINITTCSESEYFDQTLDVYIDDASKAQITLRYGSSTSKELTLANGWNTFRYPSAESENAYFYCQPNKWNDPDYYSISIAKGSVEKAGEKYYYVYPSGADTLKISTVYPDQQFAVTLESNVPVLNAFTYVYDGNSEITGWENGSFNEQAGNQVIAYYNDNIYQLDSVVVNGEAQSSSGFYVKNNTTAKYWFTKLDAVKQVTFIVDNPNNVKISQGTTYYQENSRIRYLVKGSNTVDINPDNNSRKFNIVDANGTADGIQKVLKNDVEQSWDSYYKSYYFAVSEGDVVKIVTETTTGINDVKGAATVTGIYNLQGMRLNEMQQGVNILQMSDGSVKKVIK